jgi:hypothetical protein
VAGKSVVLLLLRIVTRVRRFRLRTTKGEEPTAGIGIAIAAIFQDCIATVLYNRAIASRVGVVLIAEFDCLIG